MAARPKPPISQWIVQERKRLGLKTPEVARRLREAGYEAEDTTYRTWEAGRSPKAETIVGMEKLFGSTAPRDAPSTGDADLASAIRAQTAAISALVDELRLARAEGPAWAAAAVRAILHPSREVLSRAERDVAAVARRDQVEVEEDAQNAGVVLYVEHLEPSEPGKR